MHCKSNCPEERRFVVPFQDEGDFLPPVEVLSANGAMGSIRKETAYV